jgi:hypothetical protein
MVNAGMSQAGWMWLAQIVARSASRQVKLCTGMPSSVCLRAALCRAWLERWAAATGSVRLAATQESRRDLQAVVGALRGGAAGIRSCPVYRRITGTDQRPTAAYLPTGGLPGRRRQVQPCGLTHAHGLTEGMNTTESNTAGYRYGVIRLASAALDKRRISRSRTSCLGADRRRTPRGAS